MLTWLGKLLGITPADAPSEPTPVPAPAPAPKPKAEKKPAAKKAAPKAKAAKKDDGLDAMNKRDLLAMAKDKGVKANASMNKEAVIKALRA
jgi:hypothetical protein